MSEASIVPLEALQPWPDNPRAISKKAAAGLRASLKRFGQVQDIVVNRRSGRIVGGHQRLEALRALGEKTARVTYVDLPDAEEKALNVTLNNPGISGEFTKSIGALIGEIKLSLPALDFDELRFDELADANGTVEDQIPEPPVVATSKRGEIWQLGRSRLLCGDATDAHDVGRLLSDGRPALLVTDPPYGVRLDPRWRDGVYNKCGPAALPYMTEGHANRTLSGDTIADWSPAFALAPSLDVAYVWHATSHLIEVGLGLEGLGFELRQQIIWCKPIAVMSRSAYNWQHEPCWYAVRKGKTASWHGSRTDTTIWHMASPKQIFSGSGEEKFDHPAQKPVEAMARAIRHHDGQVYDPFLGSGTTLIAAEQLDRVCYGLEIEPRYCDVIVERWQALTGQKARRM